MRSLHGRPYRSRAEQQAVPLRAPSPLVMSDPGRSAPAGTDRSGRALRRSRLSAGRNNRSAGRGPTTHPVPHPTSADCIARMLAATRASCANRYMTRTDAIDLLTRACDSSIPDWVRTPPEQQPGECRRLGEVID